ncbi:MAG: hypothetical protein UR15_C0014G0007 [Parcubacteria group bacterium GW2011_GWA2_31_28]|nr:MAG: hypothetical protein UR15_C0014G0007 [Parcubacteria group bacterium GW2011_GWA2_31_28]
MIISLIAITGFKNKKSLFKNTFKETNQEKTQYGNNDSFLYSFSQDSDLDGLSDAKEIIYGSDPKNPDTDNDIYTDGREVENGYDPIEKGEYKLSERDNLSLTIQYFTWVLKLKNIKDPQITDNLVQEFLQERDLLNFTLPIILESEINFTNTSKEKIKKYLNETEKLNINENGSYLLLAKELLNNKRQDKLNQVLQNIDFNLRILNTIQVPPETIVLHKLYLGIFTALKEIFEELKNIKTNPVAVLWRAKQGEWITEKVKSIEGLRQELN